MAVLGWSLKEMHAWFTALDVQCAQKATERLFEDPDSFQQVPAPSLYAKATKSLTIIVPAYNEARRISPMLDEAMVYLQARRDRMGPHFTYEVIVVDDGSRDTTREIVISFVRRYGFDAVRLLKQPANFGKGAAVKAGMLCARGCNILFADADGATVISDVESLEKALDAAAVLPPGAQAAARCGKRGMAVGSRAHLQRQAENRRHPLRNFLMYGFHSLVMLVVGGSIHDTQCGFKLMTRSTAQVLFANTRLQRWCFDVELIFLAQRLHVPVCEIPIDWTEVPGSKLKITSIVHMAWELLALLIGYRWLCLWHVHEPGVFV